VEDQPEVWGPDRHMEAFEIRGTQVIRRHTRWEEGKEVTRTWKGKATRRQVADLVAKLRDAGAFSLKDKLCRCPHPGFRFAIKHRDERHEFAARRPMIEEEDGRPYREVFDAVKEFVLERAATESKD
jgi:hypothetical protein